MFAQESGGSLEISQIRPVLVIPVGPLTEWVAPAAPRTFAVHCFGEVSVQRCSALVGMHGLKIMCPAAAPPWEVLLAGLTAHASAGPAE